MVRPLDTESFETVWKPALIGVFGHRTAGIDEEVRAGTLFADQAWQRVAIPESLIASGPSKEQQRYFGSSTKEFHALDDALKRIHHPETPYPFVYRDEYEGFFSVLRGNAESEFVLSSNFDIKEPEAASFGAGDFRICTPDRSDFDAFRLETFGPNDSGLAFDASGTWGAAWSQRSYSLMAGDEAFMSQLMEAYGGEQALMERFQLFLDHADPPIGEALHKAILQYVNWA